MKSTLTLCGESEDNEHRPEHIHCFAEPQEAAGYTDKLITPYAKVMTLTFGMLWRALTPSFPH